MALLIIILVSLLLIWFLMADLFEPIGSFICYLFDNSSNKMNKEREED